MADEITQIDEILQIATKTRTVRSILNCGYKVSLECQEAYDFKIKSWKNKIKGQKLRTREIELEMNQIK